MAAGATNQKSRRLSHRDGGDRIGAEAIARLGDPPALGRLVRRHRSPQLREWADHESTCQRDKVSAQDGYAARICSLSPKGTGKNEVWHRAAVADCRRARRMIVDSRPFPPDFGRGGFHILGAMTPPSLDTFLAASAGVAGALIGLLFVAISVAQERLTAENANPAHRVRASAALTAFGNALAVALFGLVPGIGLRGPAFVVGLLGLLFVVASLLLLLRVRESHPVPPRDVLFLAGLVAVFGLQLYYALRLIATAGDVGAARGIAVLIIVCFFIGIARAWELVGGPSIGLGHELMEIVRTRRQHH